MAQRRTLQQAFGNLPPPEHFPTRPLTGTPAQRRDLLRNTDDETGEMEIERYIYRADPCRSTSRIFPSSLPLFHDKLDPRDFMRLRNVNYSEVTSILGRHGIVPTKVHQWLQSKPGHPGGKTRVPVIQVEVDATEDVTTHQWSAAKRDIKHLLNTNELQDFEVEIVDP